jgi:hypothetical protein
MSHRYHPDPDRDPDDALIFDDCPDCDDRADDGVKGLLNYDDETLRALWRRMREVEHGEGAGNRAYRTENEAAVCRSLYHVAVLLGRHPGLFLEAAG